MSHKPLQQFAQSGTTTTRPLASVTGHEDLTTMRYAVLRDPADLLEVAACWPIASIEAAALWVVPAADQASAERFAGERFPNRPWVVLALPEAESILRQHLANRLKAHRHTPGRAA